MELNVFGLYKILDETQYGSTKEYLALIQRLL